MYLKKLYVLMFFIQIRSVLSKLENTADSQYTNNLNTTNYESYNLKQNEFTFLVTGGYRPEDNNLVRFVISLRTKNERKYFGDNHFCGGAIIGKKTILTAAHCLFHSVGSQISAKHIKVVAGTPKRLQRESTTQVLRVAEVKPHRDYTPLDVLYDIAIIKLQDVFDIDLVSVDIIPLINTKPRAGTRCTVIGWGSVIQYGPMPDEAIFADVTIYEESRCQRLHFYSFGMICAANPTNYEVDSCQGDSGGPLICEGKLTGIVSFGDECGKPHSAGVYTDVYYFNKWIAENSANRNTVKTLWLWLLLYSIAPYAIKRSRFKIGHIIRF